MCWESIVKEANRNNIISGYLYSVFTDKIQICCWPPSQEEDRVFEQESEKLLEVRIFDPDSELRAIRMDLSEPVKFRYIRDADCEEYKSHDFFDETQYIQKKDLKSVRRVKQGSMADKILIRKYLGYYSETGQAYIKDWRLVDFC